MEFLVQVPLFFLCEKFLHNNIHERWKCGLHVNLRTWSEKRERQRRDWKWSDCKIYVRAHKRNLRMDGAFLNLNARIDVLLSKESWPFQACVQQQKHNYKDVEILRFQILLVLIISILSTYKHWQKQHEQQLIVRCIQTLCVWRCERVWHILKHQI